VGLLARAIGFILCIQEALFQPYLEARAAELGVPTLTVAPPTPVEPASANDLKALCKRMTSSSSATLYVRAASGELKDFNDATLEETRGRNLELCYVLPHSDVLRSADTVVFAAISVKIELAEVDPSGPIVHLFSNHTKDDPKACPGVSLREYQDFHSTEAASRCLYLHFHDPRSPAQTADGKKRKFFAFDPEPDLSKIPIKLSSRIYYYSISSESTATPIPFKLQVSPENRGIKIVIDDVVYNEYNEPGAHLTWKKIR